MQRVRSPWRARTAGLAGLVLGSLAAPALAAPKVAQADIVLSVGDRQVPVQVLAPARGCHDCTLVIFSHGALATPGRYDVLLRDWAAHGLVVASPLHVDSEEHPERARYAKIDSRVARLADYAAVDAALRPGWKSPLRNVTLSGRVIAAGHSYGALIAQFAGGATAATPDAAPAWRTPAAVVALSPPGPLKGLIDAAGWSTIQVPMLVVTGTTDVLPAFTDDWHLHLVSYRAVRPGLGYALTFDGMNHYFNGAYGRPTPEGAASAGQVATLNRLVERFLDGAPTATAWRALSASGLSAEAR